jgi:hypothetical protein
VVDAVAAFVAWMGASLVVLADGRRGLALGAALATAGISVIGFSTAGPIAGALALGGGLAAFGRLRSGPTGWGIMPPGSTPRLVLCIAAGLFALWVGAAVMTGPGSPMRFAVLLVAGLMGARVLGGEERSVLLTATGLLALAMGLGATGGESSKAMWAFLAAGLIAAAVAWLPPRTVRAA